VGDLRRFPFTLNRSTAFTERRNRAAIRDLTSPTPCPPQPISKGPASRSGTDYRRYRLQSLAGPTRRTGSSPVHRHGLWIQPSMFPTASKPVKMSTCGLHSAYVTNCVGSSWRAVLRRPANSSVTSAGSIPPAACEKCTVASSKTSVAANCSADKNDKNSELDPENETVG
jgi:hypothetical protein